MTSGGARTRSGPAPDPSAIRRGRSGDPRTPLPAAGREGDPPAWPLPGRAVKFELETWAREWARPQAIMWERLGWEVQVALYVRTLRAASGPRASAGTTTNLLRQMENLGLTEAGMARNQWRIDEAGATPVSRRGQASTAKDRIRLLQGGADAVAS